MNDRLDAVARLTAFLAALTLGILTVAACAIPDLDRSSASDSARLATDPPAGSTTESAGGAPEVPACGQIDVRLVERELGNAYLLQLFAAGGDVPGAPTQSNVVLYEDGRPLGVAHSQHADIRALGAGRFSHWHTALRFASSDNSDPRTNGRSYTYAAGGGQCPTPICGRIDASRATSETGYNHIIEKSFGFPGDTGASPTSSGLRLFEDDRELGPPHTAHADVRALGAGRFSHWGNALYFSSSDGSSPATNGRAYLYGGPCRKLAAVETTRVASDAPGYSTFQSHNQKVVENQYGIFMTYLEHAFSNGLPEGYGDTFRWRLARSTDQGRTFSTVYEDLRMTKAPVLETDEDGNVYVVAQDYAPAGMTTTAGDALFLRFDAASGFATPNAVPIRGGAAGKFVALYDSLRKVFYYFTFNGGGTNFFTLDKAGNVIAALQLAENGPVAALQYPHLAMRGSTLFAAWTTVQNGVYLYWDIHFVKSEDGGRSWQKADGTPLTLPVVADNTGPADGIVPAGELGSHNWLASMFAKGNSLHFMYLNQAGSGREHHVRFDLANFGIDRNPPNFSGETLAIKNLDGFFTSRHDMAGSLLYAVSSYQWGTDRPSNAIVVLASDDNGATWFDYALSRRFNSLYSIGGGRRLGNSGHIDGSFTNVVHGDATNHNGNETWFFRVQAE